MPIAVSPDDGRFDAYKALRLDDLPDDRRDRVVEHCARKHVSPVRWIRKAIEDQIDRELAGIEDGRRVRGYVYVFGPLQHEWVKVGYARRPRKRLAEVRSSLALHHLAMFFVAGTEYPRMLEALVHDLLAEQARGFEQFVATPERAVAAIRAAVLHLET